MADNSFDYVATIEFILANSSRTATQIQAIRTQLDGLASSGKIADDQFQQLDNSLGRAKGTKANSQAVLGLKTQLYDQAQAYQRVGAAGAIATTNISAQEQALATASQQNAIYNQYLYDQAKATTGLTKNLPQLRYALYDVSFAAAALGGAALGADAAVVKTAIDFQREFADVARTTGVTGDAAKALEQDFISLSQSIPVSFADLSQIGTLAGQLGVATSNVANFTDVTAKFGAVTGVSIDDSATAFGRLDALLPDVQGNYLKLADAIDNVGVNSVATEQQIIDIATQIAGISQVAGLSSNDVIGLSGALASLGLPAERSRGLVTRLFTNIQTAIATTSPLLEQFGKVSGETGAQFAATWKSAPSQALITLLKGINATGSDAIQTIQSLGLASARDVPALAALAQPGGIEILAKAFDNAANSAGTLAGQYNIVAQTVSAKLTKLGNDFQALFNSIGSSVTGPLADFLDFLQDAVRGLTDVANSKAGQVLSVIGIVFAGLVGVVATGAAGLAIYAATLAAVTTAFGEASAAATIFKVAAISTGIGALVVGIGALVAVLLAANGAFDTASDKAQKYFGDTSQIQAALQADQTEYEKTGKAIQQVSTSMDKSTKSTKTSTIAYGENAKAALVSALSNNAAFKKLFSNNDASTLLKQGGGSATGLLNAILGDPVKGGEEYLAKLRKTLAAGALAPGNTIAQNGDILNNGLIIGQVEGFDKLNAAVTAAKGAVQDGANQLSIYKTVAGATGVTVDQLTGATNSAGDSVASLSDQYGDQVSDIFDNVNALNAQNTALESAGEAFATSGAAAAFSGQDIQTYINSVIGSSDSSSEAADQIQILINSLVASGYAASASSPSLQYLGNVVSLLGGSSAKSTGDISSFTSGIGKVGSTSSGAAKQVRTLVDYANDLQTVFSRAFDIRFGSQSALDVITTGFSDIADATAEANRNIADYQAKIQQLTADNALQAYFLKVANAYGDSLRAGEISAQISQNNSDIADATNSLTDAQDGASKSLTGNSKAAIANRKTITGLVSDYQDYIQSLASSGASQDTLNQAIAQSQQQFIAQATALGYSNIELQPYIQSFRDMTVAINNVPRNITVKANTDPAKQAINELLAQARSASGQTFSGPQFNGASIAKAARAANIYGQIAFLQNDISRAAGPSAPQIISSDKGQIAALSAQLNSGNYAHGGYTGPGGKYQVAGIVHRGEYVIPKEGVNQRTGMPYSDALGRSMRGSAPASNGYAGGGFVGGSTVAYLAPEDRALLRSVYNKPIYAVLAETPTSLANYVDRGNTKSSLIGAN